MLGMIDLGVSKGFVTKELGDEGDHHFNHCGHMGPHLGDRAQPLKSIVVPPPQIYGLIGPPKSM